MLHEKLFGNMYLANEYLPPNDINCLGTEKQTTKFSSGKFNKKFGIENSRATGQTVSI